MPVPRSGYSTELYRPHYPPWAGLHGNDVRYGCVTDPRQWKPLSPGFTAALRAYDRVSRVRLRNLEVRNAITAPLYHYTTRGGLEGVPGFRSEAQRA